MAAQAQQLLLCRRIALIGFGSVNQNLVKILAENVRYANQQQLQLRLVGVADSKGAIFNAHGFNLKQLLAVKQSGRSVAEYAKTDGAGDCTALANAVELAEKTDYDLLVEASPTNLKDQSVALGCVRASLSKGRPVVVANKGVLVLDFWGLHALAAQHKTSLLFSASCGSGMPTINIGQRDLVGATVTKVEAVVTFTANMMLQLMSQGSTYDQALAEAQRQGIAEREPSLDVDGWDTAYKLVILVNSLLHGATKAYVPSAPTLAPTPPPGAVTIDDVKVSGIRTLTKAHVDAARSRGAIFKLVATAELSPGGVGSEPSRYTLSVAPREVPERSFLGTLGCVGVSYSTDIYGDLLVRSDQRGALPTAAAVLRDVTHALVSQSWVGAVKQ